MITAPSPFPDVEALEPDRAAIRELAAHIYSAQAELALKVAKLDDDGAWAGDGYLSIVHWLSIHLGLGRVSARELVRVGHALVELTKVAEAFASDSLSYDKVRFICQVATPQDQEVWVELAQTISGSQLIKICLAYMRAKEADSQERAEAQLARRGLWTFKEDDGMLRLTALLPAEDAAVVMTAIEAVSAEQPPVPVQDTSLVPDPAEDRRGETGGGPGSSRPPVGGKPPTDGQRVEPTPWWPSASKPVPWPAALRVWSATRSPASWWSTSTWAC